MQLRTSRFPDVCYQCQDRTVGCHGSCKRYKDKKTEYEALIDALREEKSKENMLDSYHAAAVKQSVKRKKRRSKT